MKAYIAYFRVSTDRQGASGLGLLAQEDAVKTYCAGKGHITKTFTEIESGRKNDRPQLALALREAKKAGATLVIAKLDRLARNVHFVSGLLETGVEFVACDLPNADRFMIQVYAAVGEQEARAISARTKAALQAAKARGTVLGANGRKLADRNRAEARAFAASRISTIQAIQDKGITSLNGIAQELTRLGVKTYRGKSQWQAVQVGNLLNQAEMAP